MTLEEAVSIAREGYHGLIPISGYETEHFYIFTGFVHRRNETIGLARGLGAADFAVEKHTGKSGFVTSRMSLSLDAVTKEEGWEQFEFKEYKEVRDLDQDLIKLNSD